MANPVVNIIINAKDNASSVLGGVSQSMTGLGHSISTALGTLAGNLMTSAISGLTDLGRAALDIGVDSVKMATDFESSMTSLTLAAAASGLSMDALHDATIAVGGDTRLLGVSATGAAESITGLFKAGLKSSEVFGDLNAFMNEGAELGGALRASIDLAAATELDMVQASDLAAIAIASFGNEAKEAGQSVDQWVLGAMNNLVQAADASVAEVSGLADALVNLGPTASAFGISFADVNNALALLSTRGIQGSQAGTAIKSMLTNMMRQTPAVTDTWKKLGIALFDSEGRMKSLPTIMGDLENAMADMTEEQRNITVQTLAGTFGMNAMNTLLAEGKEGWDEMAAATASAATIQEQAAAKGTTLAAQWEAFEGTLETLKIQLGEALLPVLKDLLSWAAGMVDKHGPALAKIFETIGTKVQEFMGIILDLLSGETSLEDILPPTVLNAFEILKGAVKTIGDLIGGLLSGETKLEDLVPPEVLGIFETLKEAIAAIGGLLSGEMSLGDILPPEVMDVITSVQGVLDTLGAWWETNGPAIREMAATLFAKFQEVMEKLASDILPWVAEKLELFSAWFEDNGPLIKDFIDVIVELALKIMDEIGKMWTFVGPLLDAFITQVLGLAEVVMQLVTGDFAGAWQTITEIVDSTWASVTEAFNAFMTWVAGWFGSSWAEITATWAANWEQAKVIVANAWTSISTTVTTWFTTIKDFISITLLAIQVLWDTKWTEFFNRITEIWTAISTTVTEWFTTISDFISITLLAIQVLWDEKWTAFFDRITEIWTSISTTITEWFTIISDFISITILAVQVLWDEIWTAISTKATEIWTAISTTITEWFTTIQTFITDTITAIQTNWNEFWTSILTKVTEIWSAIKEAISGKLLEIIAKIEEIVGKIKSALTLPDWSGIGKAMIGGVASGIASKAKELADKAADAVRRAISAARKAIGAGSPSRVAAQRIGAPIAQGIGLGIRKEMPRINRRFVGDMNTLLSHLDDTGDDIVGTFLDMGGDIDSTVGDVREMWNTMVGSSAELSQGVSGAIAEMSSTMVALMGAMLSDLLNTMDQLLSSMVAIMDQLLNSMVAIMDQLLSSTAAILSDLPGIFTSAFQAISATVSQQMGVVVATMFQAMTVLLSTTMRMLMGSQGAPSRGPDNLFGMFISTFQMIVDAAMDFRSDFEGAGIEWVQGLIGGIASMQGALVAQIQQTIQAGVNAMQIVLGISSPSKVTAKMVGMPMAEGIGVGFERGMSRLENSIGLALRGTASGATAAPAQAGQTVIIHNLILQGVQDSDTLLRQLQAYSTRRFI